MLSRIAGSAIVNRRRVPTPIDVVNTWLDWYRWGQKFVPIHTHDHQKMAALTAIAALTRARGARRFQRAVRPSCAEQTDRLEPAVRLWSTSPFLFSGLLLAVWLGATMELGRSMMSAGAGATYGVIDNRSENLQH